MSDAELEKPDPPIVGKVTHSNIQLYWGLNAKHLLALDLSGRPNTASRELKKGDSRIRFIVQEEEIGLQSHGFGTVYSGYSQRNVFEGLEPRTTYRYRLKVINDSGSSPFSAPVEITTTKKPPSSEDLHKAVNRNDVDTVKHLIAELNKELINVPDKYGNSPLMVAAQKGYVELAEVLISHLADVEYQNSSGKNGLMMACYAGQLETAEILRKHGASWETRDRTGSSALHWAIDGGNFDIIRWMINEECPIDVKDFTSGWTPLVRLAAMSGDVQIARVLTHHGANVNSTDHDRKSVLMMAALNGHIGMVKLLVSKGADIQAKSCHDKTALDFAKSFDHRQVTLFLEEQMEKIKEKEKLKRKEDAKQKRKDDQKQMKEQRSSFEIKDQLIPCDVNI